MEYFTQNMYYPSAVQPASAGLWSNTYQIGIQQQPAIPTVYYQMPTTTIPEMIVQQPQQQIVPTAYYQVQATAVPEVIVQQAQPQVVPTVYYQPPTMAGPPITTTTVPSEGTVQQPSTNTTTTTKTVTTRVLDPTTTVTTAPPVERSVIEEKVQNQPRGLRTSSTSTSTSSDVSTTSTESTITPVPEPVKINPVLPPVVPIHTTATTNMAPVHRVIHRPYTPSGYVSSDLDYGRRKIYKTDYKYRHYYCCNVCRGRWDLRNRSYSCFEWFYGFPVWCLLITGLLFLALLAGFFTLLGLQPSLNSSRRAATAETRLLNRTEIVYGFYKNCGYHINATSDTPTTLILCTNTATTTTARVELSPFYTVISGANTYSYSQIFILFCYVSVSQISTFLLRI